MVRAGARSTLLPIVPGNHGLGMNPTGNFLLTLRFFDQVLGRSKAPGLVAPGFTASPTSGVAPLVTLTASATPDGNWFASTGVFLNAASSFGDAALRQVEFFCDGVPPGLDTVAPFNLGTGVTVPGLHVFTAQALTTNGVTVATPAYAATFNNLAPGSYTGFARATDAAGASTTSAPVTFRVLAAYETEARSNLTNGQFTFTHARFGDGSVNYSLDVSTNLATWTSSALPATLFNTNGPVWQSRSTEPQSATNSARKFFRVNTAPVPLP